MFLKVENPSTCQPSNYQNFLLRLKSFSRAAYWFAKPNCISCVQCALVGWCNKGRNVLICYSCKSEIVHKEDGMIYFIIIKT